MPNDKAMRPKARLPNGFRDRDASDIATEARMLAAIRGVYDSYGFDALETPSFEYTDALGKFLPDLDRPNAGVFSLQDEDGQWLSLRYDLTAPLARYCAQNSQRIPTPFRRYQIGTVWRNEKPGPGRFREFTQCDADIVGSSSPSADAELLMMFADALEAVGLKRGDYVIKVNSRKLLDGVLEAAHVDNSKRGTVLRAIDKLDRLGAAGVRALLGAGRKDESGDFTKGADLDDKASARILQFISSEIQAMEADKALFSLRDAVSGSGTGEQGADELGDILRILNYCGYGPDRVRVDSGIVRGLDYYTGPVFEAQLLAPVQNEAGETVVFGSVGGGGRYDDLVARFTGQTVPASGISIGVSRLLTALKSRGAAIAQANPLVVVLVMDKAEAAESFQLVTELRNAGVRAEAYVGDSGMKAQLRYADKRNAVIAVIEGSDERAKGEVTLKDLALGAEMAKDIASRADWVSDRPAQSSVKRQDLVQSVRAMLAANAREQN